MEKNLDKQAQDLAQARVAVEFLTLVGPGAGRETQIENLLRAFTALDDGRVFQEIDEHTSYEPAEETLKRVTEQRLPRRDPAEWGDLTGYATTEIPNLPGYAN